MNQVIRKLRGVVGVGLTWGIAWGVIAGTGTVAMARRAEKALGTGKPNA